MLAGADNVLARIFKVETQVAIKHHKQILYPATEEIIYRSKQIKGIIKGNTFVDRPEKRPLGQLLYIRFDIVSLPKITLKPQNLYPSPKLRNIKQVKCNKKHHD